MSKSYFVFLFCLMTGLSFAFAQPEDGKSDKAEYAKYETEDVTVFRQRGNTFEMPVVLPPVDDPVPVDKWQKVSPYFTGGNKFYIEKSPSLAVFIEKHKEIVNRTKTMQGYRVQVFIGIEREAANNAKGSFLTKFPGVDCYMKFQEPSYRIRAGNFITRADAEEFSKKARSAGFLGAFVVREDDVVIPKLRPLSVSPSGK
ncbi:MAG: SPOR domain-containing protein [Bacteroidia bacterium]|nr:SPOR domain-containing protein [Bacteroidia bacterium]